jgi:hypothetical protein
MMSRYRDPSYATDWRELRSILVGNRGYSFDNGLVELPFSQHRDSDSLTRSNYRVALRELEEISDAVRSDRSRCPLFGWSETIVAPITRSVMEWTLRTIGALEQYPVLDDEDFFELEAVETWEYWISGGGFSDALSELDDDHAEWIDDHQRSGPFGGWSDDEPTSDAERIAADIVDAGWVAFSENSEEYRSGYAEAAEAMAEQITRWHEVDRWNRATLGGRQMTLELPTGERNER